MRWVIAIREAMRRVQAWKTAGSRRKRSFAEDLDGCLLENVVGEIGASQAGYVAAQRGVAVTEELFQGSPIAGWGEKDEKGLVGRGRLLRMRWGMHAWERG